MSPLGKYRREGESIMLSTSILDLCLEPTTKTASCGRIDLAAHRGRLDRPGS